MDFFVMVVRSPGYIFGPLMLFAGLFALGMCIRAMNRTDRAVARQALWASLLPPVFGVLGAIVGLVVLAFSNVPFGDWGKAMPYLGCTIVFGVFVAIIPAVWSFVLVKSRPAVVA